MNNRIKKYLQVDPVNDKMAKCVVISDDLNNRVVLSYEGQKLIWYWASTEEGNGLKIPSSERLYKIHPLAAEAYIVEEIAQFMSIEKLDYEDMLTVNSTGIQMDGIRMSPPELGKIDFDIVYKKEIIKELYGRYLESGSLTEDIVGDAIGCDVLKPLLSLTNME